jgi:uncharacterized protein YbaP (TraB family)
MSQYGKKPQKSRALLALLGAIVLFLSFAATKLKADEALLWSVKSPNGAVLYLLGSVHMAKESIFPLKPVIMNAFSQATRLYIEVDPDNAPKFEILGIIGSKGMYDDGRTLMEHLDPAMQALLEPRLNLLPMGSLSVMKPWLAAVTLDVLVLEGLGYRSIYGIDRYFLNLAKEKGIKYVELETHDKQINLIADMTEEESKLFLKATLLDLNKIDVYMEELLSAWTKGDEKAFYNAFFETFATYPELSPLLEKTIFERNVEMAKGLFKAVETPGLISMAVVGSGHMIGPRGIPAIFRKAGFEVTKY